MLHLLKPIGWEILTENKILLIGEIKEDKENEVITKPAQYGSYVLGYSRRIKLFYNKIIDEDIKPENERNNSRRNIAKLIMNGLYGKILQRAHFKKTIIANKISEIFEFMDDYDLTGWEILL